VAEPTAVACQDAPVPRGRQAWIDRIARFQQAGESPASFCARERVSLPSFYSWRRRLAAEASGPAAPGVEQAPAPRLLPVRLQGPVAAIEVVLPSGVVLRLAQGCDPALVRSLLCALGGPLC
jgi:hypothetical protein